MPDMIRKHDILLSVTAGLCLVFSFSPFNLFPLAWIALVPLLTALSGKSVRSALMLGLTTGTAFFLGTIYWVFHSMHYYGYLPVTVSISFLLVLCLYLGLYFGICAALFSYMHAKSKLPAVLTVPVLWVTLEYGRTYLLTGFPWALLGYSQHNFLALIQIADITGIYGVSFLVAACNGLVFDAVMNRKQSESPSILRKWPLVPVIILFSVLIAAVLFYGTMKLNVPDQEKHFKVSVIQGNIDQHRKWDRRVQQEIVDTYTRLTEEAAGDSPDLVVWPETAVPFTFGADKNFTDSLLSFQEKQGHYLLFGSVLAKDPNGGAANSAVLLSPDGRTLSFYDKIHLVPYGEYVPLRKLLPFVEKLTGGIGDFIPGKERVVMDTPFATIGNLICYEIIFPDLVRDFVHNGANVLVTITNDAWFGNTSAPYQHFATAIFRAVENRVPVVRAANTGISGFIDSRGRVLIKSDIFAEAVLTEGISPGNKKSFYSQYGDIFAFLCVGGTVLMFIRNYISKREA